MSIFSSPAFWLSVSFIIFLSCFIKLVLPILLSKINSKISEIHKTIKFAEDSLIKSEKLLSEATKIRQKAVEDAKIVMQDATKESKILINKSKFLIEEEMNKKLEFVKNNLQKEQEKLISDLKNKIITSAVEVIENTASNSNNIKSNSSDEEVILNSIENMSRKIH
jgi:F0F1-type ATP synthase membrane subunit b/b'